MNNENTKELLRDMKHELDAWTREIENKQRELDMLRKMTIRLELALEQDAIANARSKP